ncbi:hypothetical protein H8356DRAFT_1339953 [Neocallimastix lanati (nom. inval.)]|nr:hypothetical protein H8356DRAFT_1339953 [Neocallimastix sp. JGI-2020a]
MSSILVISPWASIHKVPGLISHSNRFPSLPHKRFLRNIVIRVTDIKLIERVALVLIWIHDFMCPFAFRQVEEVKNWRSIGRSSTRKILSNNMHGQSTFIEVCDLNIPTAPERGAEI